MTETTDFVNAGECVEIGGQAYTLPHVGPGVRAKFSTWAKNRSRRELKQQHAEGVLSKGDYAKHLDRLEERMDAGSHNWGSPLSDHDIGSAVEALLNDTDGVLELFRLLLEKHHGPRTTAEAADLWRLNPVEIGETLQRCLSAAPNAEGPDTVVTKSGKTLEQFEREAAEQMRKKTTATTDSAPAA